LDEAEQWLQRLLAQARADGREGDRIELLVLRALWAARTDRHATALTTLTKALTLAEPEGYVRTFVDEGAPLAELLRQIAARDRAQAYVSSLLHAFPRETGPSGLVEPLSEREIEVLRLIAEGHTTRHIAERAWFIFDKKHLYR
jgi:LuxR family maltose regulon positive regulatory protein